MANIIRRVLRKLGLFEEATPLDNDVKNMEVLMNELFSSEANIRTSLQMFYLQVGISLIASAVSACEFRTFKNDKEVYENEYYLWNVEPNQNQNSTEFIQQAISKMLLKNECLIFPTSYGGLEVADSFSKNTDGLSPVTFSGITKNGYVFPFDMPMNNVLYLRNADKSISQFINGVCSEYAELQSAAFDKYLKSGGEKIILGISAAAEGSKNFEKNFYDMQNKYFKEYFENRNAVLPLFEGFSADRRTDDSSKGISNIMTDIKSISEQVATIVAQGLKIPSQLILGNVADIEKVTENFLTFGVDTYCNMLEEEINRKRYGKQMYIKGNYMRVDSSMVRHTDVFGMANNVDKLISCGVYSVDELRYKLGEPLLKTPEADAHYITKNYESMNIGKEG